MEGGQEANSEGRLLCCKVGCPWQTQVLKRLASLCKVHVHQKLRFQAKGATSQGASGCILHAVAVKGLPREFSSAGSQEASAQKLGPRARTFHSAGHVSRRGSRRISALHLPAYASPLPDAHVDVKAEPADLFGRKVSSLGRASICIMQTCFVQTLGPSEYVCRDGEGTASS